MNITSSINFKSWCLHIIINVDVCFVFVVITVLDPIFILTTHACVCAAVITIINSCAFHTHGVAFFH